MQNSNELQISIFFHIFKDYCLSIRIFWVSDESFDLFNYTSMGCCRGVEEIVYFLRVIFLILLFWNSESPWVAKEANQAHQMGLVCIQLTAQGVLSHHHRPPEA